MVWPCLTGRLKTETSRFARFSEKTAAFRLHAWLTLCQLSSIVPLAQTAPVSFSPPHSSNAISKALPTNLATQQRTAPPTGAVSLNHLQLWQTQRGKSFLLSDETGSCSFFCPRQSVPSVSRSQLVPDVHHKMARCLHLWGSRGEMAEWQAAFPREKGSRTPSQRHPRAEENQRHPPEPDVWTLIRGFSTETSTRQVGFSGRPHNCRNEN